MKKRGATKTTTERSTVGFVNGVQLLAQNRNQDIQNQSGPYHKFTEAAHWTATLIAKSSFDSRDSSGTSFFSSLWETIGKPVRTPDLLKYDIAGFALANPMLMLGHGYSMLNYLQDHVKGPISSDEYTAWWRSQMDGETTDLKPFLMAGASMLEAQIVIWTQEQKKGILKTAHLFTPPIVTKQYHFIADQHLSNNSDVTWELISEYVYVKEGQKGWQYRVSNPVWDPRIAGRNAPDESERLSRDEQNSPTLPHQGYQAFVLNTKECNINILNRQKSRFMKMHNLDFENIII